MNQLTTILYLATIFSLFQIPLLHAYDYQGNFTLADDESCSIGSTSACLKLGFLEYEKGKFAKAKSLFTKACDGGEMEGCNNLGILEYKRRNFAEARKFYTQACNGGKWEDVITSEFLNKIMEILRKQGQFLRSPVTGKK